MIKKEFEHTINGTRNGKSYTASVKVIIAEDESINKLLARMTKVDAGNSIKNDGEYVMHYAKGVKTLEEKPDFSPIIKAFYDVGLTVEQAIALASKQGCDEAFVRDWYKSREQAA